MFPPVQQFESVLAAHGEGVNEFDSLYPIYSNEGGRGITYCASWPLLNSYLRLLSVRYCQEPSIALEDEIDRYLFTVYLLDSPRYRNAPTSTKKLITAMTRLPLNQVPRAWDPDMIHIFRNRLITGTFQNELEDLVFRYAIPGLMKSRSYTGSKFEAPTSVPAWARNRTGGGSSSTSENLTRPSNVARESTHVSVFFSLLIRSLFGSFRSAGGGKRLAFPVKMYIFADIRRLLLQDVAKQEQFIRDHINIFRLTACEYFAEVVFSYVPVEQSILRECFGIEGYTALCFSSVDTFRTHLHQYLSTVDTQTLLSNHYTQDIAEVWRNADNIAFRATDKIVRSTRIRCKLSNNCMGKQVRMRRYVQKFSDSVSSSSLTTVSHLSGKDMEEHLFDIILDLAKRLPVIYNLDVKFAYRLFVQNMLITDKLMGDKVRALGFAISNTDPGCIGIHENTVKQSSCSTQGTPPSIENHVLDTFLAEMTSMVHETLQVHPLPANIARIQMLNFRRVFRHDPSQGICVTNRNICLSCVLRVTPKQFATEHELGALCRLSLDTYMVFCNRCGSRDHMIEIDILGRILQINGQRFYLCPYCCLTHEWRGDGKDLFCCPNERHNISRLSLCVELDGSIESRADRYVRDALHVPINLYQQRGANVRLSTAVQYQSSDLPNHVSDRVSCNGEMVERSVPGSRWRGTVGNHGGKKFRKMCFVCGKICANLPLSLLHVKTMQTLHVSLCGKHHPPAFLQKLIVDTVDYEKWLQCQ